VAVAHVRSGLALGVALVTPLLGCVSESGAPRVTATLRSEAARLQLLTAPPTSDLQVTLDPELNDEGVEVRWDIQTPMAWPEYARWVRSQLAPEFTVDSTGPESLTWRKLLEADRYVLSCTPASLDAGLVHVRFLAAPW
jgi:hypothetical protein